MQSAHISSDFRKELDWCLRLSSIGLWVYLLFQDDVRAVMVLNPGDKTAMHAQVQSDPLSTDPTTKSQQTTSQNPALPLLLSVRFRPQESGWGWSGPVCAASLGSFCVKIRGQGQGGYSKQSAETTASQKQAKEKLWFAVAEVQEASPSLIVVFQKQVADAIPYRIENGLRSGSILYQQKVWRLSLYPIHQLCP